MIIGDELIGNFGKASFSGKTFSGIIVNETKETITMNVNGSNKILIKSGTELVIGQEPVPLKRLNKRPEDRIKLLKKKWTKKN